MIFLVLFRQRIAALMMTLYDFLALVNYQQFPCSTPTVILQLVT